MHTIEYEFREVYLANVFYIQRIFLYFSIKLSVKFSNAVHLILFFWYDFLI